MIHFFDRIGGKWAIMVIDALGNRPMRFNEVLRSIAGISHRMLTLTLKALDRDGLVVRRVFATIPPKVEYKLTPLGRSLIEPVRALIDWTQKNQAKVEAARAAFDARAPATPQTCSNAGSSVVSTDLRPCVV